MLLRYWMICILALSPRAFSETDLHPRIYRNPDQNVQFQAITQDESGFLYALDQYSRIYRFNNTSDGDLTNVNVSSPINWSHDPAPMGSQILLTTATKGEILACNHVGCGLMDSENHGWTQVSYGTALSNSAYIPPSMGIVGFNSYVYIASLDDGTSVEVSTPILSVRELRIDHTDHAPATFSIFQQNYGNLLEGQITINQSFRRKHPWKIKPIFLSILPLEPNPFGYLITVQSSLRPDRSFESRLGRFCAEDKFLMSYSETTLECHGEEGIYTIAMSGSTTVHEGKAFLAVVFGKSAGGTWETFKNTKRIPTTALCVFPLEEINRHFNDAFDKCRSYSYKNTDDESQQMTKLSWIVGYEKEGSPKRCRANRASMCQRSPHLNDYIDVKGVLDGQACVESRDIRGLQLLTIGTNSRHDSIERENIMAATYIDKSELLLVHLNMSAERCQSDLLSSVPTEITYRQHEFLPSVLTKNSRSYVVLSDNKVQWFPVGCGMHSTCAQCMEANKRMGCGWCDSGYCSAKDQCKVSWFIDRCSPVIESFSPRNGSIGGGANVTIRGELFGSENAVVAVSVAGVPCPIVNRLTDEITCKTLPSNGQGPVEISVTSLENRTRNFKFDTIGKHHLASQIFSYLIPQINSVSHAFGPKTGNTLLTLFGTNMRIGNKQEILIAGILCRTVSVNDTAIACYTGRSENSQKDSVVLMIDGMKADTTNKSLRFEYRNEPIIEDPVDALRMTMSGYNTFVFDGSNLDSFSVPPALVTHVTTVTGRVFRLTKTCFPVKEPAHLKCPAISITPYINNITDIVNITATLTGSELTGSLAKIFSVEIYSDPDIYTWDELKPVICTERQGGQYILQLSGKGLRTVLMSHEYRITADELPCSLARVDEDEIECRIPYGKILDGRASAVVWATMGNAVSKELGAIRFDDPVKRLDSVESSGSMFDFTAGLAAVCGLFVVTIVAVAVIFVRQAKKKLVDSSKPFTLNNAQETTQLMTEAHLTSFTLTTQQHLQDFWREKLIIHPTRLMCGRRIGSGSFGTVYEGRLRAHCNAPARDAERVAIKVITAISSSNCTKEIIQEASIMKDLRHRHIVKLHGVLVGSPLGTGLVMEFMANGDLHTYIRKNEISHETILDYSIQIAEGMAYLSVQKIVHRDLAARNCMLDEELNIRIADFGLSRDLYQDNIYIPRSDTQLPYRWIALECFTGPYSTNSDVWSFGVVMWELFEKGLHPYGEMDAVTIFGCLNDGFRLAQPGNCSEAVYKLMCQCWHANPCERPHFQSLCVHLRALVNNLQFSFPYQESVYSLPPQSTIDEDDAFFNCTYGAPPSSTRLS